MINVRELLGDDYVAHFHKTHVIPEKFRSKKPDGVYDMQERNCMWRDVIVDRCTIISISKMWLDNGGPEHLPPELRVPWGTYPAEAEEVFDYGE